MLAWPRWLLALAVRAESRFIPGAGVGRATCGGREGLLTPPGPPAGLAPGRGAPAPGLATGDMLGAYALTEPNSGSDAASLQTTAAQDGDHYVLNGTKIWVTTGLEADIVIVYARTDPAAPKAKGISAFIVPVDTPGVRVGKKELKVGIRGSSAVELQFEDSSLAGRRFTGDLGAATVDRALDVLRIALGVELAREGQTVRVRAGTGGGTR